MLRTNTRLKPLQVVLRYRNLLAAEDACKTTKALLATRPIFHKTDAAIRGHVFCSFLALVLRKDLMDRLTTRRGGPLQWARIVTYLVDLSAIEVEQDAHLARLRTALGPSVEPICRALGITLPTFSNRFRPKKTRSSPQPCGV